MATIPDRSSGVAESDALVTETDGLAWQDRSLPLSFKIGEWTLWTVRFRGLNVHPDPFAAALDDPAPPHKALAAHGRRAAFVYALPVSGPLPVLSRRGGWLRYAVSQHPHYAVEVDGSFDDYCQRFRRKTLSSIRRKTRRIAETNGQRPMIGHYASAEAMDEFFELALPISRKSYQQRFWGLGLDETPEFRERIRERARRGEIIGFILFIRDQAAAYTLCPRTAPGRMLYDHTGYDPAFEAHSPGTVMQFSIIETMFADPRVAHYDLCIGGGRHKELFATRGWSCADIYYARLLSWMGMVIGMHSLLQGANVLGKRLLDRLDMRDRVKAVMRRHGLNGHGAFDVR